MSLSRLDDSERLARELDWNLLRTFIAIVQEGGITAAADRLLLKQPSVSNALKRLETRLGKRLIDRGPSHFRVTDAGQSLYREALEIHGTIARLTVEIRDIEDEVRGHVNIRVASHVVFPPLDETLRDFSHRHPRVTFDMTVATSADVAASVLEKKAGLGICLVHRKWPTLSYTHLFREHFAFFCGPTHRFFGRRDLTEADLDGEPSVAFDTDSLQDALRPVAILRTRLNLDDTIRGTSSHLEEVKRLIVAGVGIGPLPIHAVARDIEDGLLWQLPPYEDPTPIDIFLVTNPASRLNRAEKGLIEMLTQKTSALPPAKRVYPPQEAEIGA
ncbi:LysR family transcriptional regulator [Nisaea sediminum]|uniref:LysR family transcriptional regulator n=1 Tax=Nisaea sediminum TaxID=2775867 RepID=UPI0018678395|nr:LysR family transcriptional regulator [Nisaea sediminum]